MPEAQSATIPWGGDQPGLQGRGQREGHRRRIAAGVRNQPGAADALPEQLRQAVGRLRVQLGMPEPAAVPLFVVLFALQAEVRAHVDEEPARLPALPRDLLRKPARQRGEHHVALLDDRVLLPADRVAQPGVRGVKLAQGPALKVFGAEGRNPRRRVAEQQPDQLGPGIARRAEDSRSYQFPRPRYFFFFFRACTVIGRPKSLMNPSASAWL